MEPRGSLPFSPESTTGPCGAVRIFTPIPLTFLLILCCHQLLGLQSGLCHSDCMGMFDNPINIWERTQITKLSLCNFLHHPVTLPLFDPNIPSPFFPHGLSD